MTPADPYPVLRMMQSHLEGRLRQGGTRLWLTPEAAEALREIVRMKPRPRPVVAAPDPLPAAAEATPVPEPETLALPVEALTREEKEARLSAVRARAMEGTAAKSLGTLRDTMVWATGDPMAEIVLIGEAPGADEERQGEPFTGPAGQLLTKVLKVMGLERSAVYITNICKYRPAVENQSSGNRAPTPQEMDSCLEFVREEMAIIRPKVIVALGGTAIAGLAGIREGVMNVKGRFFEFDSIPVMATLHPSYLLEKEQEGTTVANAEKRKFWEDMLLVMDRAGMPVSEKQRGYFLPK